MPGYDLEILRQNRQEILKAELGAFLHNIGKFGEEFLFVQLANAGNTDPIVTRYRGRFEFQNVVGIKYKYQADRYQPKPETTGFLSEKARNWLASTPIVLPPPFDDRVDYCMGDFVEYQNYDFYRPLTDPKRRPGRWVATSRLTELLWASHEASAIDKEGAGDEGRQSQPPVQVATVFGHERGIDASTLRHARESLLDSIQQGKRNEYLRDARRLMTLALAETRRPLNDITLWDVSSAVAAFFKAALAKMLLEGKWTEKEYLKWRILRIALDGPTFYEHVSRLPDLLARKQIITHSLDAVKDLLEQECPLGNEVYRDEFGSAFVVPDLEAEDERGSMLLSLIEAHVRSAFITPIEAGDGDERQRERSEASKAVKLEITPALSVSVAHAQGLGLAGELAKPVPLVTAKPETVRQWWQDVERADVCTVCGVRPQGHPPGRTSRKAKERRVCVPCEALRDDRCEQWLDKLETTIWLDEVADVNGRVALIVGRFGIEKWLEPGGYIESSLIVSPTPSLRSKELTFARLRRIWDTTARFWEEIEGEIAKCVIPVSGIRWRLTLRPGPGRNDPPVRTHAYQLEIPDVGRLAVACTDENGWKFITAENLARLAKHQKTSPDELREQIRGKPCAVLEDTYNDEAGYTRLTSIATGTVLGADLDSVQYRPSISILADPRSFMMLVPADGAADVVNTIKNKYEAEMARVRNRLPIAVGIVFGQAHTPLSIMLDAGRRVMDLPVNEELWAVSKVSVADSGICGLEFSNGIAWKIPTSMGDGTTEDKWYAYFLPANSGGALDVGGLRSGGQVYLTPSHFDFQFLDCAATRFELEYSDAGRKRRSPRPYLLENWNDLARVWELLRKALATSQIKAIQADIGAKRRQWAETGDTTLEAFVRDTLATADWKQPLSRNDLDFLTKAGTDGLLEDAIELYVGLLKRKTEVGGDDE
ncbi:hypothetical protein [Pseudacidobacterium ailaaui]|jgi:hypothetical protein|uniref:hypothetical protein n=1 Tax=Pseudacidobacterium ailaaui TaxID=1382359 RepID=UPI00047CF6B2|nr:hypothetical protein [Pseudacidobacterium ailaaui]